MRQSDIGSAEDTVHAQSPRFVAGDVVGYLIRCPAVHARRARVARLIWRIIRYLGLVEVHPPAISVPENLKLLEVFHEQPIRGDIVAAYDQAVRARIDGP